MELCCRANHAAAWHSLAGAIHCNCTNRDNFILQRYLHDIAETVAEASTIYTLGRTEPERERDNPFDDQPNDDLAVPDLSLTNERPSPATWSRFEDVRNHAQISHIQQSTGHNPQVNNISSATIRINETAARIPNVLQLQESTTILSSRSLQKLPGILNQEGRIPGYNGDRFAISWTSNGLDFSRLFRDRRGYGWLFFGKLGSTDPIQSFKVRKKIYVTPNGEFNDLCVSAIRLRNDGRLLALCRPTHGLLLHDFVASWVFGSSVEKFQRFSEAVISYSTSASMLSNDDRFWVFLSKDKPVITVFDLDKSMAVLLIPVKDARHSKPLGFSENCDHVIVYSIDLGKKDSVVEVWNMLSASQIYRVQISELSPILSKTTKWAFTDSTMELVVFYSHDKQLFIKRVKVVENGPSAVFQCSFPCLNRISASSRVSSDGSLALIFEKDDRSTAFGFLADIRCQDNIKKKELYANDTILICLDHSNERRIFGIQRGKLNTLIV